MWVVSSSEPQLPLQIEDASRRVTAEEDTEDGLNIKVNQDTRLDNRILDLRTPTNQAIYRYSQSFNFSIFRKAYLGSVFLVFDL